MRVYLQVHNYDDCKRIGVEIVERGTDQSKILQEITGFYRYMHSRLNTQYASTSGLSSALQKSTSSHLDPMIKGLDKFINDWTTLLSALPSAIASNSNNAQEFVHKCQQLHVDRYNLYSMIEGNEPLLRQSHIDSMVYVPLIIMDFIDFQAKLIDLYFTQYSLEFRFQFQPHLSRAYKYTVSFKDYEEFYITKEKTARLAMKNQPNAQIVYDAMKAFLGALNQYGKVALYKARAKL